MSVDSASLVLALERYCSSLLLASCRCSLCHRPIIVESLLPWLHAGSVFRLATTARFDDPLLATFTSQARTALQELPIAFEDVLLTGMNVPVFEHRRVPRLILVPSAPEQATTAEKVRAFAAIRYNLLEERPGEFERHMLQAWMALMVISRPPQRKKEVIIIACPPLPFKKWFRTRPPGSVRGNWFLDLADYYYFFFPGGGGRLLLLF